ncbi:MAG: ParB/RepB/Spo0J family partition protein [Thermoleophilia bacterium]|nr:ParB/RepB/Spo0J family partition protein [Thermoleophilia bacterium]
MAKRPVLGRGLAALLGDGIEGAVVAGEEASQVRGMRAETGGVAQGVVDLPVGSIRRNPRQPRRAIDPEALEELAQSIESVGVVQPVIVREVEEGYELIAGERRWLAAQRAGYTVVPAIIRQASDVESLELALVENVVRQQLNPVDEAYALKVLLEDLGVTQESLAARVGKSRSAIANKIRLLDLPAEIQEMVSAGTLSEGHGRALLAVADRRAQLHLARRAASKGLSVRQVEAEVRKLAERRQTRKLNAPEAVDQEIIDHVKEVFLTNLGVVPRVKFKGSGGVVEVPFENAEDLRSLVARLDSCHDVRDL